MCILRNLFGVIFHTSLVDWSGYIYSICAFCYMLNIFGVAMVLYIYGQLEGGISTAIMCAFCYM